MWFYGKFSQNHVFSEEIFLFRSLILEILRKWQNSPFFSTFKHSFISIKLFSILLLSIFDLCSWKLTDLLYLQNNYFYDDDDDEDDADDHDDYDNDDYDDDNYYQVTNRLTDI